MDQTTFGLIIIASAFLGCAGMVTWAHWPHIKRWCRKHHLVRSH